MPARVSLRRAPACRSGAVTVMFALASMPMLGLIGLGIDFGFWNQAHSQLQIAADAAAVNAVKIAGSRYIAGDSNWQSEAVQSGQQWFAAQVGIFVNGAVGATSAITPVVSVPQPASGSTTFVANVSYQTSMTTFIARMFGVPLFGISGKASATITETVYSELVLLLDNSSSMEIGASNADIAQIQGIVPCDPSAANSGQSYSAYTCGSYDGGLACPFTSSTAPTQGITFIPGTAPACPNLPPVKGKAQTANAPCAFACHWDANNSNDYYGAVRRANTGTPIQLRFDLVQQATAAVLTTAQQQDIQALHNITAGIYTFSDTAYKVFPTDVNEASTDLTGAINAVSQIAANPVTGSQGNTGNTDFSKSMTTMMANYITAAGDGSSSQAARKNLILITDGMGDATVNGNRSLGQFNTSYCNTLKNSPWGYTIYVIYTPYYSLMNGYYQSNVQSIAEGTGPSTISYALQQCASAPQDYFAATSLTQIQTALQTILKSATKTSIRFIPPPS